jgi:membrane protein YdbS with pleckstrin-like domain
MDAQRFYEWIKGAWLDIAILGLIIVFGFVRWYFSRVSISDKYITHSDGVFIKFRKTIPLESISVATAETPVYMIPFRAMKFSCDTRAGIFKATDMKLLVSTKLCRTLMSHIPDVNVRKKVEDLPKPTALSVMLFSAFFSSGFSGAIYIAMFFFKGGSIAQDMISVSLSRITETTEKLTHRLLLRIPAATIAIGTFFLAAWLLSFIVNLLRYSHFKILADPDRLNVRCGITNRREYRINSGHINYTDLRQNLIMKLCGAVTVNISCAGYGYDSQHLPVLMPIRREKNLGRGLERLGISTGGSLEFPESYLESENDTEVRLSVEEDSMVTFIVKPQTGKVFDGLTINLSKDINQEISYLVNDAQGDNKRVNFVMPQGDVLVNMKFISEEELQPEPMPAEEPEETEAPVADQKTVARQWIGLLIGIPLFIMAIYLVIYLLYSR